MGVVWLWGLLRHGQVHSPETGKYEVRKGVQEGGYSQVGVAEVHSVNWDPKHGVNNGQSFGEVVVGGCNSVS